MADVFLVHRAQKTTFCTSDLFSIMHILSLNANRFALSGLPTQWEYATLLGPLSTA
jgi:hypothetical protein